MNSSNKFLKVTPIGGVGQIGSNMTLIEGADESIIIDAGLLFPREQGLGVNYLIPNFYDIDRTKLKAIFITHCHEDHIGALKHFTENFPGLNLYTEKFTKEVINQKNDNLKCKIQEIDSNSDIEFKNFKVSAFRVNHSTAQTLGFVVRNDKDSLIYTSDFRIDREPEYEKTFDFKRVQSLTDSSEKIISFIDSTNILYNNKTPSEEDLLEGLSELISRKQRTFITFFPSNIYRFINILKLCKKHGKRAVLYGRSVHFYFKCGVDSNIIPEEFHKTPDISSVDINRDDLVILTSGCQGSFRSTLSSLARGSSSIAKIKSNDLVIFSSSVIPGNMKQIQHVYNLFIESGAEVYTNRDLLIHCSGHPGKEDLRKFYSSVKLTDSVPIHGESYFIKRHFDFLKNEFPKIKAHKVFNGSQITIRDSIEITPQKEEKDLILMAKNDKEISRESVSQRRKIAEEGLIVLFISDHKRTEIKYYGLDIPREVLVLMTNYVSNQIKKKQPSEKIRVGTRKIYSDKLGHKPVIDIIDFR